MSAFGSSDRLRRNPIQDHYSLAPQPRRSFLPAELRAEGTNVAPGLLDAFSVAVLQGRREGKLEIAERLGGLSLCRQDSADTGLRASVTYLVAGPAKDCYGLAVLGAGSIQIVGVEIDIPKCSCDSSF